MITNVSTTRTQSRRLLDCGIDPMTADMLWHGNCEFPEVRKVDRRLKDYLPAWSLSRLLELLPTSLLGPTGNEYMLELSKLRMHDAWEIQWFNGRARFRTCDKQKNFHKLWDKSPIEACVKAIEWLSESNFKQNEI